MIYTELTDKAYEVMKKAHEGQFDKAGVPYIFHPITVASFMEDEDTTVVALLHDVIEDTDYTIEKLRDLGFTEEQLEAIDCMTHRENENYLDYVRRVKNNPIAKAVKYGDLRHNMDLSRIKNHTEKDFNRIKNKYKRALRILNGEEE